MNKTEEHLLTRFPKYEIELHFNLIDYWIRLLINIVCSMRGMQFWSDTAKNVLDLWGDGALRNFRKALEAHRRETIIKLVFSL